VENCGKLFPKSKKCVRIYMQNIKKFSFQKPTGIFGAYGL
jgi:hypothetical protein